MPGIVVGADGSAHSRRALEWAAREAVLRAVPLTVITVHQIPAALRGSGMLYLPDHAAAEHGRLTVQLDAEKVLAELGRPVSVTVLARSGHPAGSVSTQVSQHARCPVVIVPAEDRD